MLNPNAKPYSSFDNSQVAHGRQMESTQPNSPTGHSRNKRKESKSQQKKLLDPSLLICFNYDRPVKSGGDYVPDYIRKQRVARQYIKKISKAEYVLAK
jgi:hypothetical protein